jgi:hypothetical protein
MKIGWGGKKEAKEVREKGRKKDSYKKCIWEMNEEIIFSRHL